MAKAACRMEKGAEWPTFRDSLPSAGPGLNPKPEGRRPKEIRSPKPEPRGPCNQLAVHRLKRFSDFEFRLSFGFRFSTFGFQGCPPCSPLWCGFDVALADFALILYFFSAFCLLPSAFAPVWLWAALPGPSAFIILPSTFASGWLQDSLSVASG
jgi:hypothetical protein